LATNASERDTVAAEIERESLATAVLILNAGTTSPSALTPEKRDEYCESR